MARARLASTPPHQLAALPWPGHVHTLAAGGSVTQASRHRPQDLRIDASGSSRELRASDATVGVTGSEGGVIRSERGVVGSEGGLAVAADGSLPPDPAGVGAAQAQRQAAKRAAPRCGDMAAAAPGAGAEAAAGGASLAALVPPCQHPPRCTDDCFRAVGTGGVGGVSGSGVGDGSSGGGGGTGIGFFSGVGDSCVAGSGVSVSSGGGGAGCVDSINATGITSGGSIAAIGSVSVECSVGGAQPSMRDVPLRQLGSGNGGGTVAGSGGSVGVGNARAAPRDEPQQHVCGGSGAGATLSSRLAGCGDQAPGVWDEPLLRVGACIVAEMRAALLRETGFRASAGVASNKTLSKLVSGLHKPDDQTALPPPEVCVGRWCGGFVWLVHVSVCEVREWRGCRRQRQVGGVCMCVYVCVGAKGKSANHQRSPEIANFFSI
eukprot:357335-Chlamydomonas_euryale.AAC.3